MIRVLVDSSSSIKQEEKEKYNVEIIPLRYILKDQEYEDGFGLSIEEFYDILMKDKEFPKTSLPFLEPVQEKVNAYTEAGDDVFIITLSSKISGTYSAIKTMFAENKKVWVIDSKCAVGGIRLIVKEINKFRNESPEFILEKINKLIPRIRILAIPETLDYLLRGGRLSRKDWIIGSILSIKPILTFVQGGLKVFAKKFGIKSAMKSLADEVDKRVDENYPIIPSYTYNKKNLIDVINMTSEKCKKLMKDFDNLDPVLGCHWGPNAFGFVFIEKQII